MYPKKVPLHTSHSEILDAWNVDPFYDHLPAIGEQWYIEIMFWQFFTQNIYITMYWKSSEQNFIVLLFLICGEKVLKVVKDLSNSFHSFWTFSPQCKHYHNMKCSYDNFPYMVTYMLCKENCRNIISMYEYYWCQLLAFAGKRRLSSFTLPAGEVSHVLDTEGSGWIYVVSVSKSWGQIFFFFLRDNIFSCLNFFNKLVKTDICSYKAFTNKVNHY